ncbi:MAG TPA: VOC family protein [Ktedonobacteraceae bacterium]|jgi:catechol 2,3-dioxygenase-like lactoylglutathione lyase family enzyme
MEAPYGERRDRSITFNHTILAARDRHVSATFFTHLFGLPEPTAWGPFVSVRLDEDLFLQFAEPGINDIQMQHDAFLVDDRSFDEISARLLQGGIEHWADPQATLPGRIHTHHGGRGVYFRDPVGHGFAILTRPSGSAT